MRCIFVAENNYKHIPINLKPMHTKITDQAHRDYEWIRNIIETCTSDGQFEIAYNVIELFHKKHSNITYYESLIKMWKTQMQKLPETKAA